MKGASERIGLWRWRKAWISAALFTAMIVRPPTSVQTARWVSRLAEPASHRSSTPVTATSSARPSSRGMRRSQKRSAKTA
ncbi:hypothetical protein D9M68_813930 [compost metagenome]